MHIYIRLSSIWNALGYHRVYIPSVIHIVLWMCVLACAAYIFGDDGTLPPTPPHSFIYNTIHLIHTHIHISVSPSILFFPLISIRYSPLYITNSPFFFFFHFYITPHFFNNPDPSWCLPSNHTQITMFHCYVYPLVTFINVYC